MRNLIRAKSILLTLLLMGVIIVSCDKDDDAEPKGEKVTVSGDITQNTTWEAKDTIVLDGFVYVNNGVTLTIEPGSVIRGLSDTKAC